MSGKHRAENPKKSMRIFASVAGASAVALSSTLPATALTYTEPSAETRALPNFTISNVNGIPEWSWHTQGYVIPAKPSDRPNYVDYGHGAFTWGTHNNAPTVPTAKNNKNTLLTKNEAPLASNNRQFPARPSAPVYTVKRAVTAHKVVPASYVHSQQPQQSPAIAPNPAITYAPTYDVIKNKNSGSSPSTVSTSDKVWDDLAFCESSGNWGANTGNGYKGGLQFVDSSWKAAGGTGQAHEASRATQIEVGKKLKAMQGWGAWGGCAKRLGLR